MSPRRFAPCVPVFWQFLRHTTEQRACQMASNVCKMPAKHLRAVSLYVSQCFERHFWFRMQRLKHVCQILAALLFVLDGVFGHGLVFHGVSLGPRNLGQPHDTTKEKSHSVDFAGDGFLP
eukprot:3987978-Amphidinium_carterae.2